MAIHVLGVVSNNHRDFFMTPADNKGLVNISGSHSVEQTVDRFRNILQSKGVTLFAVVNHRGEAVNIGMQTPPTKLLILGTA